MNKILKVEPDVNVGICPIIEQGRAVHLVDRCYKPCSASDKLCKNSFEGRNEQ